jgi:hypothetical protein
MQKLLVVFLIMFLSSCGEKPKTTASFVNAGSDSSILSIEAVRRNYERSYIQPTTFSGLDEGKRGEEIRIAGKYYCVLNSELSIPEKLIPDNKQEFKTHEFATDILIISNRDTILRKTITVKDFNGNIPSNLSEYGVLSEPVFIGYNEKDDQFDFHFGISIPLTNIAVSRIAGIKRDGELVIRE